MRLELIGAQIIVASILFAVLARILARWNAWLDKFWPLIMFIILMIGALIGVAGMISSAIQRRRKNSN